MGYDFNIRIVNWSIKLLGNDEFTIDELLDKIKENYPKFVPTKRGLVQILKWSKINAKKLKENGKYRKINQRPSYISAAPAAGSRKH